MKDGRWRTEAGGRRTVNPLADLWPLTSDLWLCAFAQQNGKPQRAKKDDRDNHVPRDVVPAIDGGNIFVPGSALTNSKGEWIIEGHGVDPDIEVDNDPASEIAGKDPQLERGITETMNRLKTPVKIPARPAAPVKTIR